MVFSHPLTILDGTSAWSARISQAACVDAGDRTGWVLGHNCQGKVSIYGGGGGIYGGIYGFLPRMQGLKRTFISFKEKKTKQKQYENKSSGKQSNQKCGKLWK